MFFFEYKEHNPLCVFSSNILICREIKLLHLKEKSDDLEGHYHLKEEAKILLVLVKSASGPSGISDVFPLQVCALHARLLTLSPPLPLLSLRLKACALSYTSKHSPLVENSGGWSMHRKREADGVIFFFSAAWTTQGLALPSSPDVIGLDDRSFNHEWKSDGSHWQGANVWQLFLALWIRLSVIFFKFSLNSCLQLQYVSQSCNISVRLLEADGPFLINYSLYSTSKICFLSAPF